MEFKLDRISIKQYSLVLVFITFVVYFNSINNEYSLDDNIVVEGNVNVERGVSGIPTIFMSRYSTDKKQSYDYRPLVLTTFAIEKQFFSKFPEKQSLKEKKKKDKLTQANISHFINLLIYCVLCVIIFRFLLKLTPDYLPFYSFLVVLIFLVHPIHTEVVCSLKNRDEMLMLIFLICSINYYIEYSINNKLKHFFLGAFFVLLSLMSKSNAMALIVLVPVFMFYSRAKSFQIILAFFSVLFLYIGFNEFQNLIFQKNQVRIYEYFENPLMHEDWSLKRIPASLYFSWFYLKMLIFPRYLSVYYGYNQIPIADWSFWQVWVSLLFYIATGIFGVYMFIKRKIVGLGVFVWFGFLFGVNSIVYLFPGIVADRFLFALSLGFVIVLVWTIMKVFKIDLSAQHAKIKMTPGFLVVIFVVLTSYSVRTIARNPDWHDYLTLFNHDVEHLTESAKVHALISNTMYPLAAKEFQNNPNSFNSNDVQKIIYHYKESIRIDSNYVTSINNLGSVYVNFLRDYDNAIKYCERAVELDSNYLEAHFNLAFSYQNVLNYDKSMYHYLKVIELNPDYLKAYDLINQLLNKHNKIKEGIIDLETLSKKSKNPKNIFVAIGNLYSINSLGDYSQSIEYFEKAYSLDSSDKMLCNHLAKLYQYVGNNLKANEYFAKCR